MSATTASVTLSDAEHGAQRVRNARCTAEISVMNRMQAIATLNRLIRSDGSEEHEYALDCLIHEIVREARRERFVQLDAQQALKLRHWRPNGSLSLDKRLTVESVEKGGLLFRFKGVG